MTSKKEGDFESIVVVSEDDNERNKAAAEVERSNPTTNTVRCFDI